MNRQVNRKVRCGGKVEDGGRGRAPSGSGVWNRASERYFISGEIRPAARVKSIHWAIEIFAEFMGLFDRPCAPFYSAPRAQIPALAAAGRRAGWKFFGWLAIFPDVSHPTVASNLLN